MSARTWFRRRLRHWRPAALAAAAVIVIAAGVIGSTRLLAGGSPDGAGGVQRGTTGGTPGSPRASASPYCRQLVVPAYFYDTGVWSQATDSRPAPSDMILDVTGVGAGTSPDPHLQAVARQAEAAGITILGYSSTVDGQRPAAEVEADARNYKAWYGAAGVFLDRVSGLPQQLAYYQQLASYIHGIDPGPSVWLNPGDYPDQRYMAIGDVVMVFEGTHAQYLALQVPSWAGGYPASKFAHTIYATPGSELASVLRLAASRNALHVYVTDGSGSNPYGQLPGYWSAEAASATPACAG
jgi:Spherulation-specific family 4